MLTEELVQGARQYLMDTYARYPLALARGQGTRVYDVEGREYLDFIAGIAVNVLGHCHPKVVKGLVLVSACAKLPPGDSPGRFLWWVPERFRRVLVFWAAKKSCSDHRLPGGPSA